MIILEITIRYELRCERVIADFAIQLAGVAASISFTE